MKKTHATPVTLATVSCEEVNRCPTSSEACGFRPRRRPNPLAVDRPARESATMRNGNAHNSNVPAKIMPWLRKSTEFRRRHRTSAEEPAYFCLPASIPRRTRCRTLGRSSVVIAALLLPPRPAGYAAGHIEPPDQDRASRVVGGAFAGARGL